MDHKEHKGDTKNTKENGNQHQKRHITRNTLSKTERLKSRKIIDQLFKEGKSIAVNPIRVYYLFPTMQDTILKAGFTTSSRHFKKAVDRNRIKRLMKEAYRLQKTSLDSILQNNNKKLALFFVFTGKELPEYGLIFEKLKLTLDKLSKAIT